MISCFVAFVAGVAIGWYLSRAPELRSWRLVQLVLVPATFMMLAGLYQAGDGKPDTGTGVAMVLLIVFIAFLLAPNIAYYCGVGLSNFLDPMDWTPVEEIALRPIRRLIDKDRYYEAVGELETLLKIHQPTHEALLIYAKLLHHLGRIEETSAALLQSLPLAHTADQQLVVAQLLAELPAPTPPGRASAATPRRIRIAHDLIVFAPVNTATPDAHNPRWKLLSPGEYEIRETIHGGRLWNVLADENWGNAAVCWNAVQRADGPAPPPTKRSFLQPLARFHQTIFGAFKRRPRLFAQADADKLFKEAHQFIRQENWPAARLLLEKANAADPHRYEIAYRWVQTVRQSSGRAAALVALEKVLDQAQWSDDERDMLRQVAQN